MNSSQTPVRFLHQQIYSAYLNREVTLSVLLPPDHTAGNSYPLVIFNDGQDFEALSMQHTFSRLLQENAVPACVIVGVHAGADRVQEYGVAAQADYAGRGSRAANTTQFVLHELIPMLAAQYTTAKTGIVYAGFSLGGLMALDAAWNHPDVFAQAGIFSGSLWWRQKALCEGYGASDRIMHAQIRQGTYKAGLRFWFECGTSDETDDRDGDGVIDSIQDSLECIAELEKKGYRWGTEICYHEVPGGMHNQQTWSEVIPVFLKWAFSGNC